MFGSKLRSWMDAVRPKKKQYRKDKQLKCNASASSAAPNISNKLQTPTNKRLLQNNIKENVSVAERPVPRDHPQPGPPNVSNCNSHHSRYSANNLSSPESAYSTGYSTDGTSPGAGAPPDYLHMNPSRTIEKEVHCYYPEYAKPAPMPTSPCVARGSKTSSSSPTVIPRHKLTPNISNDRRTPSLSMTQENDEARLLATQGRQSTILRSGSPALGLTSPRQRNRIRTNPWLPGGVPSPALARHDFPKTPVISASRNPILDSPRPRRFLSPAVRRRSLSSSSCSSLSGTSLHWEPAKHPSIKSVSDEDDCTLNEMMGKYDESYVYEKETDILSDSDPTDCETDIDTGQDGGDEDDPLEVELDFIDNGSYLEFDTRQDQNTGHCSYYNFDIQRKCSSRRRATRRNNKQILSTDKKRKSTSNKKRHKLFERDRCSNTHLDGSKSAGATPLSVRRAKYRPVSKLALEDCLKKRSNSISFCREPITTTIDKRDKEADLKYKELIVEAEHILRTMKSNGLSPRRVPGPANKRVELLRTTECTKPDLFVKNRPATTDDNVTSNNTIYPKLPSNNYNCARFSPKKNHITNFIISNSPILVRREWEMQTQPYNSPTSTRRDRKIEVEEAAPSATQKGILQQSKNLEGTRRSPKYRKKSMKHSQRNSSSSSDSENENGRHSRGSSVSMGCPQSEPVRRKVYFGQGHGKTVAFNLSHQDQDKFDHLQYRTNSSENLRQQVLLNTIANLKRNLEDQSASLKQVYRSSHNVHV